MAGAYLTIGAKFRPFSYDELIKPVSQMASVHAQIDEKLGELQEKAGIWENLANKETDPETYAKYKEYSDSLRAQAEDLAKNGLNPQSLRNLMNMRARYASDIVPIEQAYTRRRQLADEQRKLQLQNPTLKFQRDMATTSLDDMVRNPELDYGYSVNGAQVAQQANQAFSHMAKAIQTEPEYRHILNNQYYQSMLKSGYTPTQILALAKDDSSAPPELKAISKQIYDSTGVEDFIRREYPEAQTDYNQAKQADEWRDYVNSYINQGAWSAVGTTNYGTLADPLAQLENSLALQERKNAGKSGGSGSRGSGSSGNLRREENVPIKAAVKGATSESRPMGYYQIQPTDSKNIVVLIQSMASMGERKGMVSELAGIAKDKNLSTRDISAKEFNDWVDKENLTVTQIKIDYKSGHILANVQHTTPKGVKQHMLVVDDILKDTQAQTDLRNNNAWYLDMMNAEANVGNPVHLSGTDNFIKVKVNGGRKEVEVLDKNGNPLNTYNFNEYMGFIKDQMYASLWPIFSYSGMVNTNVEAGQKMEAANDIANINVPNPIR